MTNRSEKSESPNAPESSGSSDSSDDRSGNIYRRPRHRAADDDQPQVRVSSEAAADDDRDGEEERSTGIYARPRRRVIREDGSRPGFFSRLTGRHRLDEIREERYKPYTYESNEQNLKWVSITMGVWCLALVWLAFTDFSNSRRFEEWNDQGIHAVPPSAELTAQIESSRTYAQRYGGEKYQCAYLGGASATDECPNGEMSMIEVDAFVKEQDAICWNQEDYTEPLPEDVPSDRAVTTGLQPTPEPVLVCTAVWSSFALLDFAERVGLECPDVDAIVASISSGASEYPGCDTAFKYAEDFEASQDRSRLIWLLVIFSIIFVAFPYLSLVHRANRNMLTLKSEGQKHTPEWAVLHHFIPFLNLYRPGRVQMEMYKASDPDVSLEEPEAWKKEGKVRPIVGLWWVLWIAAWIFNPITVPRFVDTDMMSGVIRANNLLILSDVLLIALGLTAVLMLRQLHVWQEMRFSKVGLITVTPPPPIDPLAEALKKQEEKQRRNEEKKKSRRHR